MSPASVPLIDADLAASLLPPRDRRGHKGTFGRVSVVAGSLDYAGAALMAGAAALRAGSGLVSLYLPVTLQPLLAGRVPELITRGLPERGSGQVDAAAAASLVLEAPCDALLVGPGLAPGPGTSGLVQRLLAVDGPPAVVDAGALDALSGIPGWAARVGRPCVLTPHPGELARLGRSAGDDDEARLEAARGAASDWRQVVVLKGAHTVVADPAGRALRAPFSQPLLGTAGSGDVLAGIIASLAGQGLAVFEAAALGVYLHARAAERMEAELGDAGLMATDLLGEIPRARRELRDGAGQERPALDRAPGR
jgi:ADP-dependent NAD(P)H-hydrate dehydratase / NAD(P)H-hydrate epimerase